jgi:hypothetical protein
LAARRFLPAGGALWLGARFVLVIAAQFPHIDDVNINLTGVAFASSRIFTPSTFGSAIQARGHLGQYRGIRRSHRVPVTSPQPPDRVRARPVLHLEEPAALPPQLHDRSPKVVANALTAGPALSSHVAGEMMAGIEMRHVP